MELSDRKKKILRAIVDLYIRTAEPVASKTIAQMPDMDFSSATIRNEMAELTTLGYLEQPHTSAGRIPSPAGYRLYVDELMQDYRLSTDETKSINQAMELKMQEVDKVVSQAGKLVSQMTNLPAYAMAARSAGLTVKRFDLILADSGSFILVVMLSDSSVKNKLIRLPVELTEADLKLLGAVLNASVTELTAEQLTPELLYACTDAFYRPGNMVLSVAGNITLDQAVEACRRNGVYDAVEPPQVETIFPQEADTVQHKETTFTMPVNKPCFALGYKEAAINRGDTRMEVIADLLPDLICGGLTNLYRKLYDESLVNPEFSGDYLSTEGACIIAFTGESETPREVAQMVRDEIARLRQNGVDPELFTLVKNQMYGEMLADVENVDDAAEEMGMAFLKGRTLADEIEALATLTVDDVNKALQTMLLEENSAYIQIDPKE